MFDSDFAPSFFGILGVALLIAIFQTMYGAGPRYPPECFTAMQIGVTTRTDALRLFGHPVVISPTNDGGLLLQWRLRRSNTIHEYFGIVFGPDDVMKSWAA